MRREQLTIIEGVHEGIDFDARYNDNGIAVYLLGWEPRWEQYTALIEDEDGNEIEVETDEGEWVPDVGGDVVVCMVGDDRYYTMHRDDLVKLDDEDYCSCCGQVGCGWG